MNNPFKKKKENEPEKPQPGEPEIPAAQPAPEPEKAKCSPPCMDCCMIGCCQSCRFSEDFTLEKSEAHNPNPQIVVSAPYDQLSLWCQHDFQPSALSTDPSRPISAGRRKFKVGEPRLPNGKPCEFWRCKYLRNMATGEKFAIPSH